MFFPFLGPYNDLFAFIGAFDRCNKVKEMKQMLEPFQLQESMDLPPSRREEIEYRNNKNFDEEVNMNQPSGLVKSQEESFLMLKNNEWFIC